MAKPLQSNIKYSSKTKQYYNVPEHKEQEISAVQERSASQSVPNQPEGRVITGFSNPRYSSKTQKFTQMPVDFTQQRQPSARDHLYNIASQMASNNIPNGVKVNVLSRDFVNSVARDADNTIAETTRKYAQGNGNQTYQQRQNNLSYAQRMASAESENNRYAEQQKELNDKKYGHIDGNYFSNPDTVDENGIKHSSVSSALVRDVAEGYDKGTGNNALLASEQYRKEESARRDVEKQNNVNSIIKYSSEYNDAVKDGSAGQFMSDYNTVLNAVGDAEDLNMMTDGERETLSFVIGKYGQKEANKYLSALRDRLDARITESNYADVQKMAEAHPIAYGVPMNTLYGIASGASGMLAEGKSFITDRKLESSDPLLRSSAMQEATTIGTQNGIKRSLGIEEGSNAAAVSDFLVGTVLSAVNSAATALAMPEAAVLTLFSGNAMGSSLYDASQNNNISQKNALYNALADGIAESFFETFSVESLKAFQMSDGNTIRDLASNIGKQFATEGSEEIFTEIANILSDVFINGNNSEYGAMYNQLIDNNVDKRSALSSVIREALKNIGLAGLAGGISGGISGGSVAVNSALNMASDYIDNASRINSNIRNYNGNYNSYYDEIANTIDTSTEVGSNLANIAREYANRLSEGGNVSTRENVRFDRNMNNFMRNSMNRETSEKLTSIAESMAADAQNSEQKADMPSNISTVVSEANNAQTETENVQTEANNVQTGVNNVQAEESVSVRTQTSTKTTPKKSKKANLNNDRRVAVNALTKVLKDEKGTSTDAITGTFTGSDGKQYVSSRGYGFIVFDTPVESKKEISNKNIESKFTDVIKSARTMQNPVDISYTQLKDAVSNVTMDNPVSLGDLGYVFRTRDGRTLFKMGTDMSYPAVNASDFLNVLRAIPDGAVYVGGKTQPVYVRGTDAEAVWLPVNFNANDIERVKARVNAPSEKNSRSTISTNYYDTMDTNESDFKEDIGDENISSGLWRMRENNDRRGNRSVTEGSEKIERDSERISGRRIFRNSNRVSNTKDSEGNLIPPNISERIANTAIIDESGKPILLYHGTDGRPDFITFENGDIGFHFGSKEQAAKRLEKKNIKNGKYITAYLAINNPLYVNYDNMSWTPQSAAMTLVKNGTFSIDDVKEVLHILKKTKGYSYNSEASQYVRNRLNELGYDGIVYKNDYEGDGYSYIAFSNDQIIRTDLSDSVNNNKVMSDIDTSTGGNSNGESERRDLAGTGRNGILSLSEEERAGRVSEETGTVGEKWGAEKKSADGSAKALRIGKEREAESVIRSALPGQTVYEFSGETPALAAAMEFDKEVGKSATYFVSENGGVYVNDGGRKALARGKTDLLTGETSVCVNNAKANALQIRGHEYVEDAFRTGKINLDDVMDSIGNDRNHFDVLAAMYAPDNVFEMDDIEYEAAMDAARKELLCDIGGTINQFESDGSDEDLKYLSDVYERISGRIFDIINDRLDGKLSAMKKPLPTVDDHSHDTHYINSQISGNLDNPDLTYSEAHSIQLAPDIGDKTRKYNEKHKLVESDKMDAGLATMETMAEYMKPWLDVPGMLPSDIIGKTVFKNGSYGRTGENTTKCVRTLTYEDFKDRIAEKIGRPLTVKESLLVSQKILDIAREPQCIYCYVAADRKAYDEYLGEYHSSMDKYIKALRKGGDYATLYKEYLDGRKDTEAQKKRFDNWAKIARSGEKYISASDIATRRSRDILKSKNGKFASQVRDAEKYAQSASWAKKVEEYRAYGGDILKFSNKLVSELNSEYGFRMYSFSDFTPAFITENMQMLCDAAAKGLKSLAYTKDTDYAAIFAPTGQAINISCFAKYENGTYVMDSKQGADWENAKRYRDEYKNVGTVMVATNDNMVMWALKQPWIDVVIPYHIVKTGTKIANEYQWKNFTSASSDRNGTKTANILPTEHNNSFKQYDSLVKSRGITPRFSQYYEMVGKEITADEYMKLVNEVRLPASELSPVTPEFDLNAAYTSFDNFIKKGGYTGSWYNEGVDVNQEVLAVSDDIAVGKSPSDVEYGIGKNIENVNAYKKKLSETNTKEAFSTSLSDDTGEYAPAFYSKMERVIDSIKQNKIGAESVESFLKGKGVKDEEIKWSGIRTFLEGRKSVTKQELIDYAEANRLQIEENELSSSGDTRWSEYKIDGGSGYREYLFSVPGSDYSNKAMKAHWGSRSGVLAHARVQNFTTSDGNSVMFIEEIQSDWHNEGKKYGYENSNDPRTQVEKYDAERSEYVKDKIGKEFGEEESSKFFSNDRATVASIPYNSYMKMINADSRYTDEWYSDNPEKRDALLKYGTKFKGSPDAPFRNNYTDFVLKNMLRKASEGGYDYLAWTTGKMQEDRWSSEYAEGYRIEYDQDIPKFLKKFGKQFGAKLTYVNIGKNIEVVRHGNKFDIMDADTGELYDTIRPLGNYTESEILDIYEESANDNKRIMVPAIEITPEMIDSVLHNGMEQYSIQKDFSREQIRRAANSIRNESNSGTFNDATAADKSRWQTSRVGDTDKTVMPISDIIAKLRHDLGLSITTGNIRGRYVRGQYSRTDKGIRTKIDNNLPTVSHEVGHWFDDHYDIVSKLTPTERKEIERNLSKAMKRSYPRNVWMNEGIAEYLRKYFLNSTKTAAEYPEFTKKFKSTLSGQHLAIIESFADDINAYYSLANDDASMFIRNREEGGRDFRTIDEKLKDMGDVFYQGWVDRNHGIKRLDDAMGGHAYVYATNAAYSDAIAGRIITGDLTDAHGKYVAEGLKTALDGVNTRNKEEYRAFGEYLVCLHGPEWLNQGYMVFADPTKNDKDFMDRRVDLLRQKYPAFETAGKNVIKFLDNFMQTWAVGNGLVSQEEYNRLRKRYPNYVPFNRAFVKGAKGARRGFASQNSPVKRVKGSGLDIINPVDNIFDTIIGVVNAAVRNNVMLEIRREALRNGDANFMTLIPEPLSPKTFDMTGLKESLAKKVNESGISLTDTVIVDNIIEGLPDVMLQFERGRLKDNQVTILVGGVKETWQVNDPLLLQSITNLGVDDIPKFLHWYGNITRFMTGMITGNNVVWSITSNSVRDLGTALVYSKEKNKLKVLADIAKGYFATFRENSKNIDPLLYEYLAIGGGDVNAYSADINMAKKARKQMTESNAAKILGKLNPFDKMMFIANCIEKSPRFATYKVCRESGMNEQRAFYEAMDITVNFRRGGMNSRMANNVFPFFNAGIQGTDKAFRFFTAKDIPVDKKAAAAAGRILAFLAGSMMIGALEWLFNNQDDDLKKNYKGLSTYTKNNFFVIPKSDGKYIAIPKPRELGIVTSLTADSLEKFVGGNSHAFDEFYEYVIGASLPSAVSDLLELPTNIMKDGTTKGLGNTFINVAGDAGIVGTGVHMVANKDFIGRDIVSRSLDGKDPRLQYDRSTTVLAYQIGQLTGLSPKMLDYFFENTTGIAQKLSKALFPVGEENRDITLGVANQWVKDPLYSTDIANWMYDRASETSEKASSYDTWENKLEAKLDSNMTGFYGRYASLSKNDPDTQEKRMIRGAVLDMIYDYQSAIESGYRSDLEKSVYDLQDTSILPSVMQTSVKVNGTSHDLSASDYYDYQTKYNALYWDYVGNNIGKGKGNEGKIKIVKEAKELAKDRADQYIARKAGFGKIDDKYGDVRDDYIIRFEANVDRNGDKKISSQEIRDTALELMKQGAKSNEAYNLYSSKRPEDKHADQWHDGGYDFRDFLVGKNNIDDIKDAYTGSDNKDERATRISDSIKSMGLSEEAQKILWEAAGYSTSEKSYGKYF